MAKKIYIKNKNLIRIQAIKKFRRNFFIQNKILWKKITTKSALKKNNKNFSEDLIKNKKTLATLKAPRIFLQKYTRIGQCLIKQGKKNLIEKMFKKSLIVQMQKSEFKNFFILLENAFLNITPFVDVKTKRKGSKNIYIPYKMSNKRAEFFAIKWLIHAAKSKKNSNFFNNILFELQECSQKTSEILKKRENLLKLVEENLTNLKKKRKL